MIGFLPSSSTSSHPPISQAITHLSPAPETVKMYPQGSSDYTVHWRFPSFETSMSPYASLSNQFIEVILLHFSSMSMKAETICVYLIDPHSYSANMLLPCN